MPERRLARNWQAQRALFRNQVTALFEHERTMTTRARAEEVSAIAEKLITMAKDDTLAHRRRAAGYLLKPEVTKKLFDTLAPKYQDRPGGYTRILRAGHRRGDSAPMVILELI